MKKGEGLSRPLQRSNTPRLNRRRIAVHRKSDKYGCKDPICRGDCSWQDPGENRRSATQADGELLPGRCGFALLAAQKLCDVGQVLGRQLQTGNLRHERNGLLLARFDFADWNLMLISGGVLKEYRLALADYKRAKQPAVARRDEPNFKARGDGR
jgi:hypothetical protein